MTYLQEYKQEVDRFLKGEIEELNVDEDIVVTINNIYIYVDRFKNNDGFVDLFKDNRLIASFELKQFKEYEFFSVGSIFRSLDGNYELRILLK